MRLSTNPLIKDLIISKNKRDDHGRPYVTPTLQLLDFPEVFAGGDCAAIQDNSLPPTAQVAYQQGIAIAHNLTALVFGRQLLPAQVNIRGTLLKLGISNSAANLFEQFNVTGEVGHLIRQGTYLELLPTPARNLKITAQWLQDEVFHHYLPENNLNQAFKVAQMVGGVAVGVIAAKKLINAIGGNKSTS